MSCNGCRVLRKGCSESCILRPCLQWIETPEAQGHATVFVAKFFGRAGLMSFISAVPESQRPALFQSLLFEACGRTVNPVNGAVGLLWTGKWQVCQAAVEAVLHGRTLHPIPELMNGGSLTPASDEVSETEVTCTDMWKLKDSLPNSHSRFSSSRSKASPKRKRSEEAATAKLERSDLDLCLTPSLTNLVASPCNKPDIIRRRPETPSMNSEESVITTCFAESGVGDRPYLNDKKLLNLFV
ncbi:LOB domain-containing protein 38-like [Mangifera indica]|uniref:LOB domain-containing protein 38-like n=1 Tax=Mangifera indica TaxID=29780 RepID=UPI001CFA45E8|nr:LOB domain-containing protein 38-like [Mangifera indica]